MFGTKPPSLLPLDRDVLLNIARRIARNEDEAQSFVQEVYLRAMLLPPDQPIRFFQSWAIRVIGNLLVDAIRREKKLASPEVLEKIPLPEPDIDPQYFGLTAENVRHAVDQLPEKFASVVRLYYFEQKKQEQIAQLLNIKENTVSTRLYRAKLRLRDILSERLSS